MVQLEPEWAANRIQEGEKAIDELAKMKAAKMTVDQWWQKRRIAKEEAKDDGKF